jgi:hypothetical protein
MQTARDLRRAAQVQREIKVLSRRLQRLHAETQSELVGLARFVATDAGYRLVEVEHQPEPTE